MADTLWWQHGIIYHIYPRSFGDSNRDGVGDLKGIRRRLGHLTWLGVDAIWISPFYRSPMVDFGYDISDYCAVDPLFGTMEDFDKLLAAAHERGLRVILDFVPNHSSDQHPWFLESRASRDNPKRDWYIWRDPAPDGGPPNNWLANFGGSAWTWDDATEQYYYHAFLAEQPDLNWRNRQVRRAMSDVLRFWLDRGVDGFRVDVIWHLMKDKKFRDNPENPAWHPGMPGIDRLVQRYSCDRPEVHKVVSQLRRVIDAYSDRVLIGEIYLPLERLVHYYGRKMKGAHLPLNFQLIFAAWNAEEIARIVRDYEEALEPGDWPNWVLSNHDQKRIATRVTDAGAPLAAMLVLTLRGTPTLYYGDELGLEDGDIPPGKLLDPWEKNEPGLGFARDRARTPMPWSRSANAGFTAGKPWLPLNRDRKDRNVKRLAADPRSILSLYRRLIALRRETPALHGGSYVHAHTEGGVFAYERREGETRLLIGLNFSRESQPLTLPPDAPRGRLLLSTCLDRENDPIRGTAELRACEGVIVALER